MPIVNNQTYTSNEAIARIDAAYFGDSAETLPALAADWGQHDGTERTAEQWADYLSEYALGRWPYIIGREAC